MSLHVYPLTCGWLTSPLAMFLEGEQGHLRVPVPAYLLCHPKGIALFDSGLHPDTQTDPAGRLGDIDGIFQVHFEPGQEIAARLRALDVDPAQIGFLINSHLHFDHAGGNAQIPNARLVVQRREWKAGRNPDEVTANAYNPQDYDLGHDVLAIDGEHDLFGDGAIVCMPTYGHTPGHQALRMRLDGGEVVLTGDACYLRRALEDLSLPGVMQDRKATLASLQAVRLLRDRGAHIFYGHDPEFWATLPQGKEIVLR